MTNLEKAIKNICEELERSDAVSPVYIMKQIELAAEPDWKYPEKGELPEHENDVLCVSEKKEFEIGYYLSDSKYDAFCNDKGQVFICVAWRELPKYTPKY